MSLIKRIFVPILFLSVLAVPSPAQDITSEGWTGWLGIKQAGCLHRARVAFGLEKIPVVANTNWNIVGATSGIHAKVKCIADDNTAKLVNGNSDRMLVDIEVAGPSANPPRLKRLRNCLKQFVESGEAVCWPQAGIGGGGNPAPSAFRTISWKDSVKSLKLYGYGTQQYIFYCPAGGVPGPVWGTRLYTENSSICGAAVHISRLSGRGGNVRLEIKGGVSAFAGSRLSGVTSGSYSGAARAFIFLDPPTGVNSQVVAVLGRSWNETESGWQGVWIRRGFTNVFDAVWKKGGQTVISVMSVTINGRGVGIERFNPSDGIRCTYRGTIKQNDSTTVSGLRSCRKFGSTLDTDIPWQAVINR